MKTAVIIVLGLCFLFSCLDKSIDNRHIIITNTSNKTIYCLKSKSDSFKDPYIYYSKEVVENNNKIESKGIVDDNPPNWNSYIEQSLDSKMRLFIILKDSVDKYGWKTILSKSICSKVYKLDINDLIKCNW